MKHLLLLLLVAQASWAADWLAVGGRVGVPIRGSFVEKVSDPTNDLVPSTMNFAGGPSVELLLPFGLGVEVDAIYKRTTIDMVSEQGTTSDTASSWEFPLLAKVRLPGAVLRPYVAGGAAFRRFSNLKAFATGVDSTVHGFVAGAGLELHFSKIRISPELRYTRWSSIDPNSNSPLRNNRNQADFLVGITF